MRWRRRWQIAAAATQSSDVESEQKPEIWRIKWGVDGEHENNSKLDLICKYVIKGGGWSIVIYSAASSRGVVFVLFCLFVKFAEKSSFVSMHIIFLQRIVVETSLV